MNRPQMISSAFVLVAALLGGACGLPQEKREPWQYVTDKEPEHEVDGRMLEAFLVAKRKHIDAYRPPNRLSDYGVAWPLSA